MVADSLICDGHSFVCLKWKSHMYVVASLFWFGTTNEKIMFDDSVLNE